MSPHNRLQHANILHRWQLSDAELSEIIEENPSLRGMLFGYVSEYKVRKTWFEREAFTEVKKYDDHDRSKKGDLSVVYNGVEVKVEVKGLQTNSVKQTGDDAWEGVFACDASDRRKVTLPNGRALSTTCLLVGEFDLLAVSLFPFGDRWRFAFALNADLPRSAYHKYHATEERPYLLKSTMKISWPPAPPFCDSPFALLERFIGER